MNEQRPERVILIGPSGSGKSELAGRLARELGYASIDLDAVITTRVGMPIAAFFERYGEPAFRALERDALTDACQQRRVVIATGGGVVLDPANWRQMRPRAVILALTATPETLVARVRQHAARAGAAAARPLLAGDALARLRAQLENRQALYDQADATLATEGRSIDEVVDLARAALAEATAHGWSPASSIGAQSGRSDVYVRRGVASETPALLRRRWPQARRCWLVFDEHLNDHWRAPLAEQLRATGLEVAELGVPSGEASKSLAEVERLCAALTAGGATRRDVVLALGGGVVGDLAGFVAAVTLRGLPLAQLPTSLLAMVDASVGGKTGVNMPAGKNLVGAFYPAGIVAVDAAFLDTLPAAEYRSGMAEVIKHALIQPSTPFGGASLLGELERAPSLDPLPADAIERVLALNVAIKASVVQADERESGLRMILNFGHTAGHALEADGYRLRHGEAVALGMLVATRIAISMQRVDAGVLARLRQLLERAGLPTRCDGRVDELLQRIGRDKKNVDGAVHWILPRAGGGVDVVSDVPPDMVRGALRETGAV